MARTKNTKIQNAFSLSLGECSRIHCLRPGRISNFHGLRTSSHDHAAGRRCALANREGLPQAALGDSLRDFAAAAVSHVKR